MLVQRVITALVLLPVLLAAIWFAPTEWLFALFSGVALLMAWEWTSLMGWGDEATSREATPPPLPRAAGESPVGPARGASGGVGAFRALRWGYVALTGVLLAIAWFLPQREQMLPGLLALAALWWAAVTLLFPGFPSNLQKHRPPPWLMGVLGLLLLLSTILALAHLHSMQSGPLRLLYFFFIVFAADTGAYLAGRSLGRRKLAPNISPGKTVEGALGGLLLVAAWAMTAGVYVFQTQGRGILIVLLLSLVVAMVSIVGDLTESMFKRMAGLKDSGHILPGHGGILDRVDSILAAAPVMVLGLLLTGL